MSLNIWTLSLLYFTVNLLESPDNLDEELLKAEKNLENLSKFASSLVTHDASERKKRKQLAFTDL